MTQEQYRRTEEALVTDFQKHEPPTEADERG